MKNVLIIDDEPISIRVIRNYIGDKYKVSAVTDGSAAMKYLSKYKPDAILLDYMMPIYDGAHLLEMIKNNKDNTDIPVIVVTGVSEERRLEPMKKCGVRYILNKPVEKDSLMNLLGEVLGE